MRFRQCMTRGMTLIKMYFVNKINTLSMEIAKQTAQVILLLLNTNNLIVCYLNTVPLNCKNASSANQTALHHVKFRAIAPKLKGLVYEIEMRCPGHRE